MILPASDRHGIIELAREDFMRLRPDEYLNEMLIDSFAMIILQERAPDVIPLTTSLVNSVYNHKDFSVDLKRSKYFRVCCGLSSFRPSDRRGTALVQ